MSESFLSCVLLEHFAYVNVPALVATLRSRHPELASKLVDGPAGISEGTDGAPAFEIGDQTVAVMSMPAPIPKDAGLWARAASSWPAAKAVEARHEGHVIVAVLGKNREPLPTARLMTAVIGALIASMPQCMAVVWDGKVAKPADLWLHLSQQAFAPFPDDPFSLWLDILPFRSERGIGAVTMGLAAFVGREIEFESSRLRLADIIEKVSDLASYLVERGPVIKDGDTFGSDDQERIMVRYENSNRFGGLPVLLCTDGSTRQ